MHLDFFDESGYDFVGQFYDFRKLLHKADKVFSAVRRLSFRCNGGAHLIQPYPYSFGLFEQDAPAGMMRGSMRYCPAFSLSNR